MKFNTDNRASNVVLLHTVKELPRRQNDLKDIELPFRTESKIDAHEPNLTQLKMDVLEPSLV